MDERAETIKRALIAATGGYDDFTIAEMLRAMADATMAGTGWTAADLRRLANTFWLEG